MKAAGVLGPGRVPVEILQQRFAFLDGPAFELQSIGWIDIENPAAALWMNRTDRMNRLVFLGSLFEFGNLLGGAGLTVR